MTSIASPRPTQEDVARLAGVSRALVSLVMREAPNVSPESRSRVLKAARDLGYRPNAHARSLARKTHRAVGVLIYDVTNQHLGGVYVSFAKAAERAGIELIVAAGRDNVERESQLVGTLLEHQVDGLALMSPTMPERTLRELSAISPTVVLGRETNVSGIDVVTVDEAAAAHVAVAHLTGLGHRRIAHITGGSDNRPAQDREAAYRAEMAEWGLEPLVVPGSYTPEGGVAGVGSLLASASMPTAVMSANDRTAAGAVAALGRAGVQIPGDVSVMGFDDTELSGADVLDLTTVNQQTDRFGEIAVGMLLERMDGRRGGSRVERLEPQLVVRGSTGPVRAG